MVWSRHVTHPVSPSEDKDYRVGRAAANLLHLRDLAVPAPDQVIYAPYAVSYVRADLARIGDGAERIEWIWDIAFIQELSALMRLFFAAVTDQYAHLRYIRSDKRLGDFASPAQAFYNFSCTVWRPEVFGPDGNPVARSAFSFQTVKFVFTNLVVV